MQMAQSEEDPNVSHDTQTDVKARRTRLGSKVLARLAGWELGGLTGWDYAPVDSLSRHRGVKFAQLFLD